jgi:3-oxoacyl-(acyl-carrier-protein) synthase
VTALKSQTGYMGAGTAAAELGLGLLCARQGFVPAIARHTQSGPHGGLDLVSRSARPSKAEPLGLFLSCSWGGAVAALAARAIR